MGIRDTIRAALTTRRPAIAPTPTDSTNSALFPQDDNTNAFLAGHENYMQYTDLPNILGPMNTNVAYHKAGELHTPFTVDRNREYYVSGGGVHFFDGSDPSIERVPRSSLQTYFDRKRELPIPPALIPDNGVEVPARHYNYGWQQTAVQLEGMYQASVLTSPSQHLSRGINVLQQNIPNDAHRPSLKARAPGRKRSVI